MSKNKTRKTITADTTWTAPAGVTQVKVSCFRSIENYADNRAYPTMVRDTAGVAWGWGSGSNYILGNGTSSNLSSPVAVLGGFNFSKVTINTGTGYGLTSAGTLYAWGFSNNGQLGDGTVVAKSSPVLVLGGLTFVDISASNYMAVGITPQGKAYAWGQNNSGQLGDGTVVAKSSPVLVLGGLTFKKILTSKVLGTVTAGLTTGGKLYMWGANANGILGDGTIVAKSSPVLVLGGLTFKDFWFGYASGTMSAYGLSTTGQMYAWGYNGQGQLGTGDMLDKSSPVAVLGSITGWTQLNTNEGGSVVGVANGNAYAWGANDYGQLGTGDTAYKSSPVQVMSGVVYASAGYVSTFLNKNGAGYSCGDNSSGAMGTGDLISRSTPTAMLGGLKFSKVIDRGSALSKLGLTIDGKIYTWGYGGNGNLGVGDLLDRSTPTAVLGNLIFPEKRQVSNDQVIQVTPGTTYTIKLNNPSTYIGNTIITPNIVDSLTLEYFG